MLGHGPNETTGGVLGELLPHLVQVITGQSAVQPGGIRWTENSVSAHLIYWI